MHAMKRLFVAATLLAGCGDDGGAKPDAAQMTADAAPMADAPPTADAGFMTAAHQPLGQVNPHAGKVLDHAQLVTITYPDYALADMVQAWGDVAVGSAWYGQVGAEYGVGPAT